MMNKTTKTPRFVSVYYVSNRILQMGFVYQAQMGFIQKWMKLQLDTALNCALSSNIPIVLLIYWYNQWSFAFCFRVMLIEKEHTLLCLSTLIFIIMWTLPKINWKDCGVVSKHLIQNFTSVILVVGKSQVFEKICNKVKAFLNIPS